jgi:uncharacterized lipoprotein YehR (DUF1307 family)
MKKLLLIFSLLLISCFVVSAQGDDDNENEKIRDKMNEYIQKNLDLSKEEAKKFTPEFLQYFKEWRQTIKENRGDKLVRQQKIAEVRIRYRTRFRDLLGEQRGNKVFPLQDLFIKELAALRRNRINNDNKPRRRN